MKPFIISVEDLERYLSMELLGETKNIQEALLCLFNQEFELVKCVFSFRPMPGNRISLMGGSLLF